MSQLAKAWNAWMKAQQGDDELSKEQTWRTFLTLVMQSMDKHERSGA